MNAFELLSQSITLVTQALPVIERLLKAGKRLAGLQPAASPFSYVNVSLQVTLDLVDPGGRHAIVRRVQRVRFLSTEAGVITNPVWGEGNQVRRIQVTGAERIGSRSEGAQQVLLLRLPERPTKDTTSTIISHRQVVDGYKNNREYFEAAIERPTKRLSLKVLFPKGRPPKEAVVVSTAGNSRAIVPRLNREGRAVLAWRGSNVVAGSLPSIRWSW